MAVIYLTKYLIHGGHWISLSSILVLKTRILTRKNQPNTPKKYVNFQVQKKNSNFFQQMFRSFAIKRYAHWQITAFPGPNQGNIPQTIKQTTDIIIIESLLVRVNLKHKKPIVVNIG